MVLAPQDSLAITQCRSQSMESCMFTHLGGKEFSCLDECQILVKWVSVVRHPRVLVLVSNDQKHAHANPKWPQNICTEGKGQHLQYTWLIS